MVPATEFAELHGELRQVARDLLGRSDPARAVDWATMARAGWLGLEVGVEYDGAAATFTEVAVLLGEIGRAAACTAYPGVAALGLGALLAVAPDPDRDHLLAESVSGAAVPVTVLDSRNMTAAKPTFHLAGGHLRGDADLVLDAPLATHLLVPAFTRDGSRVLAMVIPGTPGLTVSARPAVDHTRRLGRVHADNVRAAAAWDLIPDPRTALGHLYDRAALATACDSLGISEAMLEATVAYTKVRHQFGCPIGTFQAVQHACADMLVDITVARQLVAAAIRAMATNDPGTPTAVSMAKSHTTAAAVHIAGKAMQLHGGIGYTWEHNLHTHLKRATLNRSLFGSPAAHRRRLATRYLDR